MKKSEGPKNIVRKSSSSLRTARVLRRYGPFLSKCLIAFMISLECCSASAELVFVANSGSGTLSVIDSDSATVIRTISVGGRPKHVEPSPDGTRVYVTNQGSNSVSVIDTASLA